MKMHSKWILMGLSALMIPMLSCKIIGVEENPTMVVTVSIEHSFHSIIPGTDPYTRTFNASDYWNESFEGWSIESSELSDIQVTVWDVTGAERNCSGSLIVKFTDNNQLIASTQVVTLGEAMDNPMDVWNNKVTINAVGKTRLLNALQNKQIITLSAPYQNVSGSADFQTKVVIKVQLHLKKT